MLQLTAGLAYHVSVHFRVQWDKVSQEQRLTNREQEKHHSEFEQFLITPRRVKNPRRCYFNSFEESPTFLSVLKVELKAEMASVA